MTRYNLFGWDYEHINPLTEKQLSWYVDFARQTGGPVLELACGTGGLLMALAEAGFVIDGVDLSPTMLALAGNNITQLSPDVRSRIGLFQMDMAAFQLARRYNLIIIADNSFAELASGAEQHQCLTAVHCHLRPTGKLLATIRRFDPTLISQKPNKNRWSLPVRHPATGATLKRKITQRLSADGKKVHGIMSYQIIESDGREKIVQCPFERPVMSLDDYFALFSAAGFSARVYGGYNKTRENDGTNSILCFVCQPVK